MTPETLISLLTSVTAMAVSVIAVVYTVRTYLLKSGANVRASFGMCSSVTCEDQYVSSVTLENLKDRAIVIFKIHLRIGHNYYLEIEEFGEEPLILRPFEAYQKEYGPIDLYSINMNRIDLNALLEDQKINKRIVLSTSDGKYVVNSWIRRWDPHYDFFKNHLTAVIHPRRATYKGKSYGINAKYIVEFKMADVNEEVVAIYPRDYETQKFRKFRLTKECLDSKEALEGHLYDQLGKGLLGCVEITVHDMGSWFAEAYESESRKTIEAKRCNWFMYRVVGPILTRFSDYRLRKQNKRNRERFNSKGTAVNAPQATREKRAPDG
ncbi:MAG: hypothetical protein HY273_06440 [Gammaproteobacteria bacterium]|nr:hypothetical protein [Gammaproteobacteria bacterium]